MDLCVINFLVKIKLEKKKLCCCVRFIDFVCWAFPGQATSFLERDKINKFQQIFFLRIKSNLLIKFRFCDKIEQFYRHSQLQAKNLYFIQFIIIHKARIDCLITIIAEIAHNRILFSNQCFRYWQLLSSMMKMSCCCCCCCT